MFSTPNFIHNPNITFHLIYRKGFLSKKFIDPCVDMIKIIVLNKLFSHKAFEIFSYFEQLKDSPVEMN